MPYVASRWRAKQYRGCADNNVKGSEPTATTECSHIADDGDDGAEANGTSDERRPRRRDGNQSDATLTTEAATLRLG